MNFLILRPLSPETSLFFGGGAGGWGGVQKSMCSEGFERGTDWAELTGRLALLAVGRPGIEPQTYRSVVSGITIRPLLVLTLAALPTACSQVATEKTQTVCFCLPACLPD